MPKGCSIRSAARFGGYGLYLVKGKPVFTYVQLTTERFRWEGPAALTPGKHTIVFDFKYDGPGFGKGGTGVLSVDGKEVDSKKMPDTIPFLVSFDESSTSEWTPAPGWTTTITSRRSGSPARWTS